MKMEGGLKFSFVTHLSAGQEVINNLQRINFSHLLCCTPCCCCLAKECLNSNQSLLLKSWRIVRSKEHICRQLKRLLFAAVVLLNSPQFQFCHLKTYDCQLCWQMPRSSRQRFERRTFVSNRGGSAGGWDPCWVQLKSYFFPSFPLWKLFWFVQMCRS